MICLKEIEFQSLDVELQNKRIGEAQRMIEAKKGEIENAKSQLEDRRADLEMKKSELDEITAETKAEEEKLREKARTWSRASNRACWLPSSVSVRAHVMVWVLFTWSVMLVVVASIRFRPSVSWIFVCVRRLSFANTVVVS